MPLCEDTVRAIDQWIAAHQEEYISDIKALCAIPSVSRADQAAPGAPFGQECRRALDWVLNRSKELGFTPVDHEGYCGTALVGNGENTLGMMGHIDVVPEGDGWIYPPYQVTEMGDFLIGRGVSDDKGPALAALYAARCLRDLGVIMKHGIKVFFGCSEETGMQDLQYYVNHDKMPVMSLVPDCGFPVCIAQKGSLHATVSIPAGGKITGFEAGLVANMVPASATAHLTISAEAMKKALNAQGLSESEYAVTAEGAGCAVTATGIAAHAADPTRGKSALNMLCAALSGCAELDDAGRAAMTAIATLTSGCHGETCGLQGQDEISGPTTTNFGLARLKDGAIEVDLDSRLSIAQNPDEMLKAYADATAKLGFKCYDGKTTQPFHIGTDDPAVQALMEVYAQITGRDDKPYAMGGGTYSRYLSTAISYGPGIPGVDARPDLPPDHGGAHGRDEYAHIPTLLTGMKIYILALARLDEILD